MIALPFQSGPGAFCPGEEWNALPARTRGFVRDLRNVRLVTLGPEKQAGGLGSRRAYEQALGLVPERSQRKSANPWVDEAALDLRLGDWSGAEDSARTGLSLYPRDARLALMVALAAHAREDWPGAERALVAAIALSPDPVWKKKRLDHLAWVRGRPGGPGPWIRQVADRWKGPDGLASAQEICLLVPTDALAPVLAACRAREAGDRHGALTLVEGVAGESGIRHELVTGLRAELAAEVARETAGGRLPGHPAGLYRSDAPFAPRETEVVLPPERDGVQPLPWAVLGQSRHRGGMPSHGRLLEKTDGKLIEISGTTHFLGDEPPDGPVVLVELPYGCWHCDMPGLPGLLDLRMADGENLTPSREPVRLRGRLRVNRDNPEDYLFRLEEARVVAD